jgi:hypothetical protein
MYLRGGVFSTLYIESESIKWGNWLSGKYEFCKHIPKFKIPIFIQITYFMIRGIFPFNHLSPLS